MRTLARIGPAACLAAVLLVSTHAEAWRGGGGFVGFRNFGGFHQGFGFRSGFGFRDRFGFRDSFGLRRGFFGSGFAPGFVGYGYPYPYFSTLPLLICRS